MKSYFERYGWFPGSGGDGKQGVDFVGFLAFSNRAAEIRWQLASLAQLAEHALRKGMVVGSIPTGG